MRPPGRFLRLPAPERRLLLVSLAVVALVRAGLTLISYNRLRKLLPNRAVGTAPEPALARASWAVRRAAKWVPGATCLTQALAAQVLLERQGFASDIRIGVRRDEAGQFRAHAWLLSGGRVVVGDAGFDLGAYSVLTDLGASTP